MNNEEILKEWKLLNETGEWGLAQIAKLLKESQNLDEDDPAAVEEFEKYAKPILKKIRFDKKQIKAFAKKHGLNQKKK